jgi:hypothetical protein
MPGLYGDGAGNVTVPAGSTSSLYQLSQDINVLQASDYGNANVAAYLASGNLTSNIITTANVAGSYILGDGSQLTNLPTQPGTYGNANVVTLLANFGSNTLSTTGNITGGYILGNGSQLTGLPATYGNANVNAHLAAFGSNTVVTTGNITGGYFIGDGSQLTNLPASSFGNANVAAYLPTYTGNLAGGNLAITNNGTIGGNLTVDGTIYGTFAGNISGNLIVPGSNTQVIYNNNGNAGASSDFTYNDATKVLDVNGNVQATYFIGDGSQLTGLPATYGNANVSNFLANYGSNSISATTGNISTQFGNISGGNIAATTQVRTPVVTGSSGSNLSLNGIGATSNGNIIIEGFTSAGNIQINPRGSSAGRFVNISANTNVTGNIVATGNITGSYILGNGSQLTGLPATYSDANVTTLLASLGANAISSTANITTTANVTGAYVIGNGSALSNLTGANVIGTVANAAYATDSAHATVADSANAVAGGNVSGQVANALVAGTVYIGAQPNITSVGTLSSLSVTGNISGGNVNSTFFGSGAGLSSLTGANVTGTVANATYAVSAGSATTATTSDTANVALVAYSVAAANVVGTVANAAYATDSAHATVADSANAVAGGNVTGQVANALVAGTVYTAAQPNITSVGTLSTLTVSGNIGTGGILTDGYYYANGTPVSFGGSSYGNANVATFLASGFGSNTISTTGNVTAGYFIGNGSQLTGITTSLAGNLAGNINTLGYSILSTSGDVLLSDDVTVSGNLRVDGYIYTGASNAKTITANGNAQVDGAVYKFGTGSAYFNGTTSTHLSTPTDSSLVMGNGDFTYEMWVYTGTANSFGGGTRATFFDTGTAGSAYDYRPQISYLSSGNLEYSGYNYTTDIEGPVNVTANTWHHIAVARSSGNTKLFFNGTQVGSTFADGYNYSYGGNLYIGASTYVSTGDNLVTGHVDEFRVSQGIARYTANFTPPSGPFTADAYTSLLLHCDGSSGSTIFLDASSVNDVTVDDNLVVTGDVTTSGYFIGDGSQLTGVVSTPGNTFSTISANGTSIVADSSTDTLTFTAGSGISIVGNATSDTITISATGGAGSPGGSNTQIQFNDAGAFAGNAAMTFDKVTGNITLGNIVVQPNQQLETVSAFSGNSSVRNPGQITVGDGYGGNITNTTYLTASARGSRLLSYDQYVKADNGQRNAQLGVLSYADLNASNIGTANANSRIVGISDELYVINGNSVATNPNPVRAQQNLLFAGTSANTGNANISGATVNYGYAQVNAGSRIGNAWINIADSANNGNATQSPIDTYIGYGVRPNHTANTTSGNVFGVYLPGTASTYGLNTPNVARAAGSYYFLRCDDDVAQNKLGSLRNYHEYRYDNSSSSGTLTVNKNNGQVQYVAVTEDISTVTFSNFVVSASDSVNTDYQMDTVTLVFRQDATGRTITLPTGTAYKYAAGLSTMGTTPNAVQMISVSAIYNSGTAATEYLITVSPEFS